MTPNFSTMRTRVIRLLAASGSVALLAAGWLGRGTGGVPAAAANCADTVLVRPSALYQLTIGPEVTTVLPCTLTATPGRRFLIEVLRPGINNPLESARVVFNGVEYFGDEDVDATDVLLSRTVTSYGPGQLAVTVSGGIGARLELRITQVPESMYPGYSNSFVRGSTSKWVTKYFAWNGTPGAPQQMTLTNGTPAGANRSLGTEVIVNGSSVILPGEVTEGRAILTRNVPLEANNTVQVKVENQLNDRVTLQFLATDDSPPELAVTAPADSLVTRDSTVAAVAQAWDGETPVQLLVNGESRPLAAGEWSGALALPAADGVTTFTFTAENGACLSSNTTRRVVRDTRAPTLNILNPAEEYSSVSSGTDSLLVQGEWADSTRCTVRVDGVVADSGSSGGTLRGFSMKVPLDLGPNGIAIDATDAAGNRRTLKRYVLLQASGGPGRDTSATAIGRTGLPQAELADFRSRVMFLYNASNPVQKGTAFDTTRFVSGREAVVSGYVAARDFGGLGNVNVYVSGHPEFGYAETRADGRFDMVVNGGQSLVLRFRKDKFLEAQRRIEVPVQDFAILDTVSLIGQSSRLYPVNTATRQALVGRFETDANGERQLALLFSAGTVCSVTKASGVTTSYTQFGVRLKEYTVGPRGVDAMPADLPPTSAYTYCVDMSVAEADDPQAQLDALPAQVRFDRPIVTYTREFLGVPVGKTIPSGYFDPATSRWMPAEDGRVVAVIGMTGACATLDTDGDGQADSPAQYQAVGIDSLERVDVATLFRAGDRLWRARIDHFSPHDRNLNKDALAAAQADRSGYWSLLRPIIEKFCPTRGCVVENENRVLGEQIPIAGTPYWLDYRSSRQPGDLAMRSINIPLTGSPPPAALRRILVTVDVAGRRYRHEEVPLVGQSFGADLFWPFTQWDGCDAFGRPIQGSVTATVRVGYVFGERYALALGGNGSSWGSTSGSTNRSAMATPGDRDRGRVIWTKHTVSLGAPSMASAGLNGWTISAHHFYDTNGLGTLYRGDGTVRLGDRALAVSHVFAGNSWSVQRSGSEGQSPLEGHAATEGSVAPVDIAVGPEGNLYFTDAQHHLIGAITPGGQFHRIAGNGSQGGGDNPFADGAVATSVAIGNPSGIAVAADGTVYFTDTGLLRAFSVTPDGRIHWFAGTGHMFHYTLNDSIENRHADSLALSGPQSVAVSPDGSVFIGNDTRVVRIDVRRRAHVYAGTGGTNTAEFSVEGRADSLALPGWDDLACDAAGNVLGAAWGAGYVYSIAPDGRRRTVLHVDAGGPSSLHSVAVGPDGAIYVGNDIGNGCESPTPSGEKGVYRIESDGVARYVAGGLNPVVRFLEQDGQLARGTTFGSVQSVAVGPDGALYVAQLALDQGCQGFGINRIAPEIPTPVDGKIRYPSEDGREIYVFTASGRHLSTEDAITGVVRYRFEYDSQQRLASITDAADRVTNIVRQGISTQITAPLLQTTTLTLDANNHLTVANPNNETWTINCTAGGLLTSFENPRHAIWNYTYGPDGRLETDTDPTQAVQRLDLLKDGLTREVRRTSTENRVSLYTVQQMVDGLKRHLVQGPDLSADSSRVTFGQAFPYGQIETSYGSGRDSTTSYPVRDARLGWFAPVDSVTVTKLPVSGTTRTVTRSRRFAPVLYNSPNNSWDETTTLNGQQWVSSYSAANRRYSWKSPMGRVTTVDLDDRGRPVLVAAPGIAAVKLSYHANGKLLDLQHGNRSWRYSYDAQGNLTEVRDTLERATTFLDYDAAGRPRRQDLPGARTVRFAYDANGNLDTLTTPAGWAHAFDFTLRDENSSYAPPVLDDVPSPATSYLFDREGALKRVDRPDGTVVTLAYGTSTGRLESLTTARGRSTSTYVPGTGQLQSVTSPDSVTITYAYDGPLLSQESWSGKMTGAVAFSHDIDFRVSMETVTGANGSFPAAFNYDADGMLQDIGPLMSLSHDPGTGFMTGTHAGGVTSTLGYNNYGELHTLRYDWSGSAPSWFEQVIDRDTLGRVTRVTESGIATGVREYHYDAAGRLDSVRTDGSVARAYNYDANGNRLSEAFPLAGGGIGLIAGGTYDAQDRLLTYGVGAFSASPGASWTSSTNALSSYRYTANGELREREESGSGLLTRYTYDALGNLTGARLPNGDTLTYLIDGANRRVGRKLNGVLERGWLYGAGPAPMAELDGAGNVVNRYVYGTLGYSPDLMVSGGVTYRVITDYLGSVRAVVNVANGVIQQCIDYDAWGVRTTDTNPGFQSLGYAGGLTDAATGLVRFGARDYDPAVGRWTCKDPIGFAGGAASLYGYALAAPNALVDPYGLAAFPAKEIGPLREGDYRCPEQPDGVSLEENADLASQHYWNVFWFRSMVQTGGPWDYKQQGDPRYEPFGNFNYGVAGAAAGLDLDFLLREAGRAQIKSKNGRGGPGSPGWGPLGIGSSAPYGDYLADQMWIRRGYEYYSTELKSHGKGGARCGCP